MKKLKTNSWSNIQDIKYAPYIAILILSLAVAYLLGGMQGQKEASLLKSSTTIQLVPTNSPTPTATPSPLPTIQVFPTTIPTQTPKKCQFNKVQMTAYLELLGLAEEEKNLFFTAVPGDCFNSNPNYKSEPKLNINCSSYSLGSTLYTNCH